MTLTASRCPSTHSTLTDNTLDVLDEFSKKPQPSTKTDAPTTSTPDASGPGRPSAASPSIDLHNDEAFAKSLESGMQNLLGELDANPEMQKEFERMMEELISAGAAPTDAKAAEHIGKATDVVTGSDTKSDANERGKESFQDTIRRTMERMQASGQSADAAAAAGPSDDDFLAQMMRELSAAGGGGGEEDFNKMLMGMMAQLTHKEILYEPMKELHDKFPAWMEKNKGIVKGDELARYKEQQKLVGEITSRFEKAGYSDDNEADREYIVDKMQKVCHSERIFYMN